MGLREVSDILWRERRLLELLQFKLEQEHLVVAERRTRWFHHATREVQLVVDELRRTELDRALLVDEVASQLGLPPESTLSQLAEAVPSPWGAVMQRHRDALRLATDEVRSHMAHSESLLTDGLRSVQRQLASTGS